MEELQHKNKLMADSKLNDPQLSSDTLFIQEGNDCSNLSCKDLRLNIKALIEDVERKGVKIVKLQEIVAHLEAEKDSALEKYKMAEMEAKTYDFEKEHRDRMRSQGLLAEPQNTESHAAVKQEVIASMHQQIIKLRKENRTCQEQNEIARSSEVEVRRLMAALKSKHENELKILKSKMKVQERELHNQEIGNMSRKKYNTISRCISSQRFEFDYQKLNPEETGPICYGGSQNDSLSTWETFDPSKCTEEGAQADSVKKKKDIKSVYKKFRKRMKKAKDRSSDHTGKKEEKFPDENEEGMVTPAEHKEVQSHINSDLEEDLVISTQEWEWSRLELERWVKATEDLRQEKIEWENKERELQRKYEFEIHELESKLKALVHERESFTTLEELLENTKNPNVQMSLVATEVILHPKEDDITLEKILQEKDMEIRDLKEQLQALGLKNSKAKLDQMEIHSEEETEEFSDLKEVAATPTFELKSIKSQLIRAESKHSDISMEKGALKKEVKKLEEENLKLQFDAAEEDLKMQTEYMEDQIKQARETWNIKQSEYGNEILALTDQLELLQTKVDELTLCIDQGKEESDAKLTVTEGRLLKERQKCEQTLKELNHVTDLLLYSQQELSSSNAILKLKITVMAADISSIQDELKQLQKEMDVKKSQYESERSAAEKKFNKLSECSNQLQQTHKRDCLENYEIKVVQCIKDKVGSGSYGSISIVSVNGMPCIQKRLHNNLVGLSGTEAVSQDQQKYISDKFYDECILLWKMHHPNIVQFMGIHYYGRVDEKHKMSLIMEYLPTNVQECITKCNEAQFRLPLSIKFSILRDVVYGLSHLHANDIIHRDLSAANVLLTDGLRAKIADLGVSKLVPPEAYNKFTVAPGAQYIMPPEALEKNPQYSTKLDIFSYGILSLYLILQTEPCQTKSTLKPEHVKTRQIEIGCRMGHIQQLQRINSGLGRIVIQSLMDEPESRPNAAKLSADITNCIRRAKFDFYSDLTTFTNLMGKKVLVFPDL